MLTFKGPVCLAAALALTACKGGPAQEGKTATVAAASGGSSCPPVLCGDNNGVGNVPFYELDASMVEPNGAGLRILDFYSPTFGPMTLRVFGDRLVGEVMGQEVEGDDLVDSWLTLFGDRTSTRGRLVIKGYGQTDYRVAPSPSDRVPLYYFVYYPDGSEGAPVELCNNTLIDPDYGAIAGRAIVFSGDRYDPDTLTVHETGVGSQWFNLGCPGTGAMKMHLFRHTFAGGRPDYETTVPQRQALLKMFGADYCGAGKNFTVDGQPVAFNFDQGWLPDEWRIDFASPDYDSPEAIWRENGAYCLAKPRRESADPEVLSTIFAECDAAGYALPICSAQEIDNWPRFGYAVTANPAPPP